MRHLRADLMEWIHIDLVLGISLEKNGKLCFWPLEDKSKPMWVTRTLTSGMTAKGNTDLGLWGPGDHDGKWTTRLEKQPLAPDSVSDEIHNKPCKINPRNLHFTFLSWSQGENIFIPLDCWYFQALKKIHIQFSQFTGVPPFATPWAAACQPSLSISNSWSLLKLMSIESVMPSNHFILCHPLLLSHDSCDSS